MSGKYAFSAWMTRIPFAFLHEEGRGKFNRSMQQGIVVERRRRWKSDGGEGCLGESAASFGGVGSEGSRLVTSAARLARRLRQYTAFSRPRGASLRSRDVVAIEL